MTSPQGWEKRLSPVVTPNGVKGLCLSALDLAYNKLEVAREKDLKYVGEMVKANVLSHSSLVRFLQQYAPTPEILKKLQENLILARETAE